jgi:hypothetical protein
MQFVFMMYEMWLENFVYKFRNVSYKESSLMNKWKYIGLLLLSHSTVWCNKIWDLIKFNSKRRKSRILTSHLTKHANCLRRALSHGFVRIFHWNLLYCEFLNPVHCQLFINSTCINFHWIPTTATECWLIASQVLSIVYIGGWKQ